MRRELGLAVALVAALAVAGYAQKPDFSGVWTPDVDPAAAAAAGGGGGGMRGGGGGPMAGKETATHISGAGAGGGGAPPTTTVYKTDGSEFEVAGRGGAMMKATAKWDGSKLVITTKTDNGDQVQTWSMADGKLTIERQGQNGPVKTVYKKTT